VKYRLRETEAYLEDLASLSGGAEHVTAGLEQALYWTLRRDPFLGYYHRKLNVWRLRGHILRGLLWVDVWYTVDEADLCVDLIAIREVDQTRL
jgi:hypothetical protein